MNAKHQTLRRFLPGRFLPGRFLPVLLTLMLLVSASVAQAAQVTATWTGGAGTNNYGTAANWDIGVVPNNGSPAGTTYNVIIDGDSGATANVALNVSATVDALTVNNGDSLAINDARTFTVVNSGAGTGTIANAGNITINSLGNNTSLFIDGDVTLSGGGTVTLSNAPQNRILGAANTDRLTNSDNTIQGSGNIGVNLMALTNNGTIIANVSNALIVDPSASGGINNGILSADGGTLWLQNGDFANNGVISAAAGSVVNLSGAIVTGGTLATTGTGIIRNVFTSTLANLTSSGAVTINDNTTLNLVGTITNSGTIALNSAGNTTSLVINGAVTLNGGGTVTLSNAPQNRILGGTGTPQLTNANNTIQGSGNVGNGSVALINQGTITANQSNALTVTANASGTQNNGTLQANGGTLLLSGSSVTNGATNSIIAQDASVVQLSGVTITGGTLATAGSGVIRNIFTSTLANLTNSGAFVVNDNTTLNLVGTLANSGTIALNSLGNTTSLVIQGDVTLNGGGTVTLSNAPQNRILGAANTDRLTNANNTIQGAGNIGTNQMALTNNGTIVANLNSGNRLIIDPTNGASGGVINTGILRATNGGFLRLQDGAFANAGGTINAQNASQVELSGATVTGGTLATAGNGVIRNIFTSTLANLTNSGAFVVNDNTTLNLVGTITNSGTLTLNSLGNTTSLVIQGDVTLDGGGTVTLSNAPQNRILGAANTDRLTNSDNTIQGSGNIGVNLMALTNNGTIIANVSNALIVDPSASGAINNGILSADGGTLWLQNGDFANNGVISAAAGSVVNLSGAIVTGGTLATTGTGIIRNVFTSTLANLTNSGAVTINDNTTLNLVGTITNSGTLALNSLGSTTILVIQGDVTLNGGGTVTLSNAPQNTIRGTANTDRLTNSDNTIQGSGNIGANLMALTNNGTIIANVSNALTIDVFGATNFTTAGTVTVNVGRTLTMGSGDIFTQTAGVTTVNGTLNTSGGGSVDIQGGTLAGAGIINGAVSNAGTVAPGASGSASAGILTINGAYTQTSGGTLAIEIGGPTVGTDFDRLATNGAATFAGDLNVSFINAYKPAPTTQFQVVTYASRTGTLTLNVITPGSRDVSQTYNPTNLTLEIVNRIPTVDPFIRPAAPGPNDLVISDPNANDGDGDPLTFTFSYTINGTPVAGTDPSKPNRIDLAQYPQAVVGATLTITIVANDGFDDSAPGVISVVIAAPPVANPASGTAKAGVRTAIGPLSGSDPNGLALRYVLLTQPTSGNAFIAGSGANVFLYYTSAPGFSGADSVQFQVVNSAGRRSLPATISITVQNNNAPVASNDSATVDAGVRAEIPLTATDADGDALRYRIVTPPANGSAFLANNSGGGVSLFYTSNAGYGGPDSVQFSVTDPSGATSIGTISITVQGNNAPTASDGSAMVNAGVRQEIPLVANDADGDTLRYRIVTPPTKGSAFLAFNSGGGVSLFYTSTANATGADSVQFTVTDTAGATSAPATISITIMGNSAPVADSTTLDAVSGVRASVVLTGSDADGDALVRYRITTQPTNGNAFLSKSGVDGLTRLFYTSNAGYVGSDSVQFTITDSTGRTSAPATVSITVSGASASSVKVS